MFGYVSDITCDIDCAFALVEAEKLTPKKYLFDKMLIQDALVELNKARHRLNGYLAQRAPSFSLAGSFRMCLNCEVLEDIKVCLPGGLGTH